MLRNTTVQGLGAVGTLDIENITVACHSLGDAFKARMNRDNCNINGDITVSGGLPKSVSVRGNGCIALVSFTKESGASPSGVNKEKYGSDVTAKVSGSKTFSI